MSSLRYERDVKYVYRYKGIMNNCNYVELGEASGTTSWQQREGKEKVLWKLK